MALLQVVADVLTLSFEPRYRVLKASLSGVFSSEDIQFSDRVTLALIALHGPSREIIDFSAVEAIGVPASKLLERGRQPQMTAGVERVMVVPQSEWLSVAREFADQQRLIGSRPPMIVSTLEEAYFLLGLINPVFEEVSV